MEFSLWPNPSQPPDEVLELARWADTRRWYGIWYADHYMPNTGSTERSSGPLHECWAMLPAIAAVTTSLRIGSLVTPTSVHHPAVLANRAATVDHLSGGRMVLGMGAGWQINEHDAYGIELEPPGARVSRFAEAIQIVRSMLSEERTTFRGEVFTVVDAPCDPPPLQTPLPILVGTTGPRMLRLTARHADEWNTWGGPDLAGGRRQAFLAACEDVGRDPATVWTSAQALVSMSRGAPVEPAGDGRRISGTTAQLVDVIGRYAELGFHEFILPDWNLGDTARARRDAIERLQDEVLAQVL